MNLNKLRTMSFGEVRYRLQMSGAKKVRTYLREKYREAMAPARYLRKWRLPEEASPLFTEAVLQAQWPAAEEALQRYMRARFLDESERGQATHFFIDPRQRSRLSDLARLFSHAAADLAAAGHLRARRFSYLDIEASFPSGLDWHMDPISRRRWPQKFYTEIKFYGQRDGEQELPGDVKYVWELNRHHHFAVLGKAYWLTGEEEYATEVLAQCESWIEQNPYLWGIHWTSALEVGMRALSWLWAYVFCLPASSLTPQTHARLLRMLQLHGRYISRHLSFYTSPYNHLVGESAALFILGIVFPEFPEAKRWRDQGWKILGEEVTRQFHTDGMSVEQALSYHHFTLGLYLQVLILAQRNGITVPPPMRERLEAALEFCMHSQQPDGKHPMIGDNDNAFAFYFGAKPAWDFRDCLALGAILFQRGDFKFLAGSYHEACLWLLGPESRQQFEKLAARPPAHSSLLLPESGYAVLRNGWQRDSHCLMFDCGPQSHGLFTDENVSTAHGHADALSFCLTAHGRSFLIDSGMLTYNGELRWQNHFRSGAAHNSITIDEQSACKIVGRLGYSHVPKVERSAFLQQQDFVFVEAHVTGFSCNARHRRGIFYCRQEYWLICDRVEGEGEHVVDRWLHFAPELVVQNVNGQIIAQYAEGQKLLVCDLSVPPAAGEIFCGGQTPEQGWVAPAYGRKIAAPVLRWRMPARMPAQFVTLLMPFREELPTIHGECSGRYQENDHQPFVVQVRGEAWQDRIVFQRHDGEIRITVSQNWAGKDKIPPSD